MTSSGSPGRRLRAAAIAIAPSAPGVNTSTSAPDATQGGDQPRLHQRGLAGPRRAGDDEQGRLPQPGQARRDVGVAPEEGVAVAVAVRRESLPRAGRIGHPRLVVGREAGVLGQDAGLQGDQLRARVEAQLLTERPPRGTDRAEGVGLPATAVLRQSQQRPPALAERLLTGEHRAVGRDACVVTAVEPRLQEILLGGQPQLAEPDGLEASRHPVLQLPEGRTSPEGERIGQQRDRALRGAGGQVPAGPLDLVLELLPVDVELVVQHAVAAVDGLDRCGAQRLPQSADAALHHLRCRRRGGPHPIGPPRESRRPLARPDAG